MYLKYFKIYRFTQRYASLKNQKYAFIEVNETLS